MQQVNLTGNVAILGATSYLAKDFISNALLNSNYELSLFSRRPDELLSYLKQIGHTNNFSCLPIEDFGKEPYIAIINFIGVGDPARAKSLGIKILEITLHYDQLVLDYLCNNSETKYVFMSSGAAYGTTFNTPVTKDSNAEIPINSLRTSNFYSIAKLYSETLHRARKDFTIFDIRIFNYFSRTIELTTRYLITDLINAIRTNSIFKTDNNQIMRDFLHPQDLFQLIQKCLHAPIGSNMPLDAYTQAPISKMDLLKILENEFGLRYEIVSTANTIDATGIKPNYYSKNHRAADIGYSPTFSSKSGVIEEARFILDL